MGCGGVVSATSVIQGTTPLLVVLCCCSLSTLEVISKEGNPKKICVDLIDVHPFVSHPTHNLQTLLEQMKGIFKKVQGIPPSKIPPTVGLNGKLSHSSSSRGIVLRVCRKYALGRQKPFRRRPVTLGTDVGGEAIIGVRRRPLVEVWLCTCLNPCEHPR